jgi:Holliday junction resolvasome RuvABC ATP-dependent DNA helicase subunit
LIIGPEGSGRTTILKLLNATLNKGFDKNFSTYIHAPSKWSGLLLKGQKKQEEGEEKEDDDFRIDAFQKWMAETDFSSTKIILIDDADAFSSKLSQYTTAIKFEHLQLPTMVFCISPLTQAHVTKTDLFDEIFADAFWIMTLENDDIKEIILKSIEAVNTTNAIPFEDSAIDMIAEYSLGLPGQASRLAVLSLRDAYQIGINRITANVVERVALNEGFDVA